MDPDDRELVNHLFATATAMLEDAAALAAAGQSLKNHPADLIGLGQQLQASGRDAVLFAEALVIVAKRGTGTGGHQLRSSG